MCSVITTPMAVVIFSSRGTRHPPARFDPSSALVTGQPAEAVEGCGLVALRQGRVVEYRLHEIIHGAFQRHHRLADVDQFAGSLADDVDSQYFARVAMEDQL